MTHTFDYPYPSLKGAEFLAGLFKTKSWMKPYMDKANIPDGLQRAVIKIFMKSMAEELLNVQNSRSKFVVVDSRGTLTSENQWQNEIHPKSDGFKLIADKMLVEINNIFPN